MASISVDTVKEIASKKRDEACRLLAQENGWEAALKEEGDSQTTMKVDYLYDALMYSVNKGFPWEQSCTVYALAYSMISPTADMSLSDAIRTYKKHCEEYQNYMSAQNLKTFTDYFFETFFAHYKLYQYVFNREQAKDVIKVELPVETMNEMQPFSDAKEIAIWEYEKKLEDLKDNQEKRKKERESENLITKKQYEEEKQSALEKVGDNESLTDKEKLVEIIKSVASAHVSAATHALSWTLEDTMEDLEYELEKTSVPRPTELGAPPRMKPKSPLSVPKRQRSATRAKSGKSRTASAKKGKAK